MEFMQCKACGSFSMVLMDVEVEGDGADWLSEMEKESRFYTCHVCGDNWLSIKQEGSEGDCLITFVHQMGVQPVLKRVAHMTTQVVLNDKTVNHWDYFLGDDEVDETLWHDQLDARRKTLKSICSN